MPLPFSTPLLWLVNPHRPLPVEAWLELSDRAVLARAGLLLGARTGRLPASVNSRTAAGTLAVVRCSAELLRERLESLWPVCPDCAGQPVALECARELGALRVRLERLADLSAALLAQATLR
jgi:hypothetical protein